MHSKAIGAAGLHSLAEGVLWHQSAHACILVMHATTPGSGSTCRWQQHPAMQKAALVQLKGCRARSAAV
jgi:hypothetical protein